MRYKCRFAWTSKSWVSSISRRTIQLAYEEYDFLVGSGITPATLLRIGRCLDIFYPYSRKLNSYMLVGSKKKFHPRNQYLAIFLRKSKKNKSLEYKKQSTS